ncbi:hypothetical protein K4749_01225 [Streptomyces sp. TRM72054]|uniref:hypothetical protein n=1 Tax=Streptomyces sp. TRM72054 TaxID=2870562 RepID=UPI001C8B79FB|nr:hypothetical protein [Streptomyces sp. TRM72054]MBX9392252.1 hypothetical protein [Streptomyces sp. TRM72054]
MQQRTHTQPQQPSPFAAPWPEGVIARYLTLVGATVDLRGRDENTSATCTGCGERITLFGERRTRELAQAHAERCRALPRPEAQR